MTTDFRSKRVMTRCVGALSATVLCVGVIGCTSNDPDNEPAAVNDRQIEGAITAAALDGIPHDIKGKIHGDLQGMQVTDVETVNAPAGILYRINFIDRTGRAGEFVYDRAGNRVRLPGTTGDQPTENVEGTLTTPSTPVEDLPAQQPSPAQPGQAQPDQTTPGQSALELSAPNQPTGGQTTEIPPVNQPSTQPAGEPAGTPAGQPQ